MASGLKAGVRSDWQGAILVCRKCSKKLDGGFGRKGKQSLAKGLRKRLGLKKGRKAAIGIVEVGCLDVCPDGAVTVVDTRDPGRWRIVPAGSNLDDVAAELGLAAGAVQPA
ncbi:hypothetical protein ACFO8O_03875 [Hephaestia sp. GCM10023244]|uniref:hypothetical protein n=1 Tax=unclassified Hephaestia TaxID=2631281 RepID=UPI0020770B77|nr:hypothetical protein [Hephaestia sp. MAHUQ-44]MCM8730108.1 hypothetical protein [Hephaestia sp. MAHUQ-44]